jgi:hypothetical protein
MLVNRDTGTQVGSTQALKMIRADLSTCTERGLEILVHVSSRQARHCRVSSVRSRSQACDFRSLKIMRRGWPAEIDLSFVFLGFSTFVASATRR